jgi:hypothetical protein
MKMRGANASKLYAAQQSGGAAGEAWTRFEVDRLATANRANFVDFTACQG